MATDMPTEDHAPYSDRGRSSVPKPRGLSFLNHGQLRPGFLTQETSQALVNAYNSIQDATTRYIHHAHTRIVTPEEPESMDLESQSVNQLRGTDAVTVEQPAISLVHNHPNTNPFTSEADGPDAASQTAAVRDDRSNETALARSRTWVLRVVVVLLLLIMTPGLILGVVTREVAWGIAISGAFAPAVVFFGGLYYHHKK